MVHERASRPGWQSVAADGAGSFLAALILLGRAMESYAGAWAAGLLSLAFLLLRGTPAERFLLLLLLALSAALDGELGYLGVRQTLFAAVFIVLARYAPVAPSVALALYASALLLFLGRTGEFSVLFTVGPSIILLLWAAFFAERQRRLARPAVGNGGRVALLSLTSLALSFVGAGSRTALFVWLAFALRGVSVPILAAGALGLAAVLSLPGLEVWDRVANSYDELTNPFPEVGINLRAVELLIFVSWFQTATPWEMLFGSRDLIYMPGDFLGFRYDPVYVPHNQFLGLFFQFGAVGLFTIFFWFVGYWRGIKNFHAGRFVMLVYLIVGFLVIHGFVNQDLAIAAAVLLWLARRLPARTEAPPAAAPAAGAPALA